MDHLNIHVAGAWLVSAVLLAIRLGMVLVMTPALGSLRIPVQVRVLMVLSFSALLAGLPGMASASLPADPLSLLLAACNEVVWGGMLAFGLLAAFAAFMTAGRLLDLQIGFGLASLLDPATRSNAPLLGVVLNLFATAWFLASGLHHAVLRALAHSLTVIPLGAPVTAIPADAILGHFGLMFTLGLVLVGPIALVLLLIDIAMSITVRMLPQANVFLLSTGVKIMAGLSMLAVTVQTMQPGMRKIFDATFDFWHSVMAR
ncbi:flagellar biosynthetic protein FliR [Lacisediminimonas sp.]|uniref:flagellar biosynthetic protein FliR n=1 Tax=Lacisediminimonas sp. TaxID=3060582 RepID=UPI00271EBCB2|nr:flagellar biosynthetic protein FliR [Lacisediminimonas sp.]MDO8299534.1 flagellar biosynthetic protein FliR [Lacisediminimonas sp.]MDO9215834.1 flagellar biosynthetic protein FliR [Lacisediminimonas sp.]